MRRLNLTRTVLVGAVAGLAAAYAMEQAQGALAKLPLDAGSTDEPSTVKAADRVSLALTGEPVAEPDREQAGRRVHYAVGAALGVAYALLAERSRAATAGFGALYGLAVSALLDEAAAPALKLSPPPSQTLLAGHAYGLAAHLVYGVALEAVRGLLGSRGRG